MSSLLQITNLEFGYPRSEPLLNGISLVVNRGELVWITGPAGCGKSTLLQLILGELKPQAGQIEIRGIPVHGRGSWSKSYLRREIGLFRQDAKLLPERSLFANVELPLEIRGFRKGRRRQRVLQMLRALDLFGRA
ncbi:MAG: ATP-binding cassette domain-containing protein, partial [bacterium]